MNRADGTSEIEGQSREGSGERAGQGASFKFACHAEAGEGGCLESVSEKISIQMITLIALSRFIEMKAKQRNQRKEQQ